MEWAIRGSTGSLKNAWYVNGWGCAVRPSILLQSWRLLHWNPYPCLGLHWAFWPSKGYCNAKVMSSMQEPAKMSSHAWTNSLNPGFSMDFFFKKQCWSQLSHKTAAWAPPCQPTTTELTPPPTHKHTTLSQWQHPQAKVEENSLWSFSSFNTTTWNK